MRLVFVFAMAAALGVAQQTAPAPASASELDQVHKAVDDLLWYHAVGDVCDIDKVRYTSLPLGRPQNATAPGAMNPLIIHAYTFIPKKLDRTKKQPMLVLIHGGVHGDFRANMAHIVREMVEQGYSVIAPDYRGSTGYGRGFYEAIDYGGRENDDVYAARNWMLEMYPWLDPQRVGILGWSHGGMITLMNIFQHPDAYAVAYAGVPVSDLVARLGYSSESYRQLFSAPYHIGKSVRDDIMEYRRRSPVNHVQKLQTPLLIHTNTNDEDVNVLEVEHLAEALTAAGKKFEFKKYQDAPGGHSFNRIDTKLARDSRAEIYSFLNGYLKPVNGVK
jgi:dipeptidyl aminopeptidase/acylaminoacyl peptidase